MRLLFGGTTGWDEGDKLAQAVASVGLDITAMEQRIRADPDDYDYEIAANEQSLNDAGHWGVPTLVFRGEAFFGQDRIEDLKWRIEQRGLTSA
jgi:2-hydroxychromene-2-carboxylate isomerase